MNINAFKSCRVPSYSQNHISVNCFSLNMQLLNPEAALHLKRPLCNILENAPPCANLELFLLSFANIC